MRTVIDPEFAEQLPIPAGACPTGRCDGSGWIHVSEAYVDSWAGPPPSIPTGDTEFERLIFEEVHRTYQAVRAAWRQSAYPCPGCMPRQFERWSGGHWDSKHDREDCGDCRRVDEETGRRPRKRKPREATEPKPIAAAVVAPDPEPEQIRADLR